MSKLLFQFPILIYSEQIEKSIYNIQDFEINVWFRILNKNKSSIPITQKQKCHIKKYNNKFAIYYLDFLIETDTKIKLLSENNQLIIDIIQGVFCINCEDEYRLEVLSLPFLIKTRDSEFFIPIKDTEYMVYQLRANVLDENFNTLEMPTIYYSDKSFRI
jgi:hypothetical protein